MIQAYYDGLFATADAQRSGSIGGAEAVRFFATSKLPIDALKSVWTLADQPPTNFLDKPKFAVAIRLIQLLQNKQKGQGSNLAAPEGVVLRPAFFEGVSGVSVPMPAPPGPQNAGSPARYTPQQQGPPQQQQQQQPPPQYQQQQQPPPQYQQQQQTTPPRPPQMPVHQRPASSSALVPQDPYTVTPSEQARYEQIFPEYAKDGFVYGPEAVALFSKSGVPQPVLAAIWNLVDVPIDNRLDKLEFAMAMHLIVCVGKKGMPLPGGLPMSLKHLKSQQAEMMQQQQQQGPAPMQQQQPPPAQMQQQQQQQQPNQPMQRQMMQPPPSPAMSSTSQSQMRAPSPMMMHQQQQAPSSPSREIPAPSQMPPSSSFSHLQGPPPLTKPQTLDIHDAFEGLTPQAVPASTYMQQTQPTRGATSFSMDNSDHESRYTQDPSNEMGYYNSNERAKTPEPEPAPEPPKSTKELKQNYNMGAASEELVKLKNILQKLQAENISLKASMQHLNEEEKEVQKELVATVAEISKLSNELTTLRAKVLASKSRLLEATSELKAAKEKKGYDYFCF